ncbi:MAG: FAD-dependent oxidoreductase, partial [Candidatus Bathyarchaeia archaeon]
MEKFLETDILVVGGGVAGCFAAIEAKKCNLDVTIIDKAYAGRSGSSVMASGWWGFFDPKFEDRIGECLTGINVGSEYINNRRWTEIILRESFLTFQDILSWGAELPVKLDEAYQWWAKNIECARMRVGRVRRQRSPFFIMVPLRHRRTSPFLRRQAENVGVRIVDRVMVVDLLRNSGKVVGALGFSVDTGDLYVIKAKATILAGGWTTFKLAAGYHNLALTGDAEAMAYRAGAEITGKEFQETGHFNLLYYPAWKSNAELYPAYFYMTDAEGRPVDRRYGPNSFVFFIHAGRGPIFWDFDAATAEEIEAMQKYIWKRGNPIEVERIGLDPSKGGKYQIFGGCAAGSSLPQSSGIWITNEKCATSLEGLYAAGDSCATYCWGALSQLYVPPAGLTPAAVTGRRAGAGAAEYALSTGEPELDMDQLKMLKETVFAPLQRKGGFHPRWVTQLLQNIMVPYYILYVK